METRKEEGLKGKEFFPQSWGFEILDPPPK